MEVKYEVRFAFHRGTSPVLEHSVFTFTGDAALDDAEYTAAAMVTVRTIDFQDEPPLHIEDVRIVKVAEELLT